MQASAQQSKALLLASSGVALGASVARVLMGDPSGLVTGSLLVPQILRVATEFGGSMTGGVASNLLTERLTRSTDFRNVLRNEDLSRATGDAIAVTMLQVADTLPDRGQRGNLQRVAARIGEERCSGFLAAAPAKGGL